MNPAAVKTIAAKLLSKLSARGAKGTGKAVFPFCMCLGQAKSSGSGVGLIQGKEPLSLGDRQAQSVFFRESISAKWVRNLTAGGAEDNLKPTHPFWLFSGEMESNCSRGELSDGNEPQRPLAKFVAALSQSGLPLNSFQLPSGALPRIRSLLLSHGMSVEQLERLLQYCTSENGTIEVDKLVVPLLGSRELQGPVKEPMVIRAEQRPALEALLSELQLAPQEIRRLVEGAITSGGDLDAESLIEGLTKVEPRLTREIFVEICHKRSIQVQPQTLAIEKDRGLKPAVTKEPAANAAFSLTKPEIQADSRLVDGSSEVDHLDGSATTEHNERLEMASRFRQEGARPEQVKRLLERLAGKAQPVHEIVSEAEGQNVQIDDDIQALLARLQARTHNYQPKSGRWANQGKTIQGPSIRAGSEPGSQSSDPESGTGEATRAATAIGGSQQKIHEAMATELGVKRLQTAIGTEHGTRQAGGKGTVSEAIAAIAVEGTVAAKVRAMSPSTGGSPQSATSAVEPQVQVAQRFVIMTANGESRTRLNLYPPELGQIQIDISLESNRLSATLVTETQVVKELLEANLGQLRQHLAQHNLQLEDFQVTVGADASPYKESNHGLSANGKHRRQSEVVEPTAAAVKPESRIASQSHLLDGGGRIDLFA